MTLARAVYSRAEILLLDDILAALDVHTSRWIVDKCLKGDLLKDRTVILVVSATLLSEWAATYVALDSQYSDRQFAGIFYRLSSDGREDHQPGIAVRGHAK